MIQDIELRIMPSGNIAVYREYGFIPTEQLTEEEKEFIVECVHKELGWTRPAFEVDGSIGSPDYERGFKHGRDFQAELSAKSTDTDKVIAYLVHQKGYPISTNGEIPSYEETFESVKSIIENSLSKEPGKSMGEVAEEYSKRVSDGHNYRDLTCGFIDGAEWQKEQMLKDAMETEVWSYSSDEDLRAIPLFGIDKFNNLKDGDKVRIVVLKVEEE